MNFFVLGLPRSRTAWLANFLTHDGLFCFHEGINGCRDIEDYKKKLGKYYGDSSTILPSINIDKLYPCSPKLIIDREIDRACEFSYELYGRSMRHELRKLKSQLDNMEGLHIPYKEIDLRLEEIWYYFSDRRFDALRAEQLIKMNVQLNPPYHFEDYTLDFLRGEICQHTL